MNTLTQLSAMYKTSKHANQGFGVHYRPSHTGINNQPLAFGRYNVHVMYKI